MKTTLLLLLFAATVSAQDFVVQFETLQLLDRDGVPVVTVADAAYECAILEPWQIQCDEETQGGVQLLGGAFESRNGDGSFELDLWAAFNNQATEDIELGTYRVDEGVFTELAPAEPVHASSGGSLMARTTGVSVQSVPEPSGLVMAFAFLLPLFFKRKIV